jgi:FMN phosphatase YigB (HAD superfamily)
VAEPKGYRAVLWDLDDTLVPWQTVERWQWAWRPQGPRLSERHVRAALRRGTRRWDRRRWRGLIGAEPPADEVARHEILRNILFEIAGHPLPEAETEAVLHRLPRFPGLPDPFRDVRPCLAALKQRGIPMAVVAPEPGERAVVTLRHERLDEFVSVVGAEADAPRVPVAEAFRRACERLGSPPGETVYVGDLYWSDARAASRAGLWGLLLDRNGWWTRVESARIASLTDFAPWFDQGPPPERPKHDMPEPTEEDATDEG